MDFSNLYECVFVVQPYCNTYMKILEDEVAILNLAGKVTNAKYIGLKKLAYEIKGEKEGHYFIIDFEANPAVVSMLERRLRVNDNILKFITIKKEWGI